MYLKGDIMENRQELPQRRTRETESWQDLPQRKIREETGSRPKDYMVYMATVQTVICIFLFGGLLIFSRIGGETYDKFKNDLAIIMSNDMGISGVKNAFEDAVEFVMAPPDKWKGESEDNTENTIPQKSMELGKGGVIEELVNGKAPQNTSFAPYTITAKITNPLPTGTISSPFGFRKDPITGEKSFHAGLDIAADEGSRIAAAYSGVVKKTGKDERAGNFVILEHSGGLTTFYCHCSELLVVAGENIRAGETIAKVGSTGYSTGPHLHFEIRINDIKYNPLVALDGVI